ncbi:hypothetical protein ACWDLG_40580 [Nonomuraea sp. NPDC003727]
MPGWVVFVPDVAGFAEQATAAGAYVIRPGETQPHGDLRVELEGPFGDSRFFAGRIADMTSDELKETASAVNP